MPFFANFLESPVWRGHSCPRNASGKNNLRGLSKAVGSNSLPLLALTATLALAAPAQAQRQSLPAFHAPAGTLNRHVAHAFGPRRASHSPFGALPFPFFGDSFALDNLDQDAGASPDSGSPSPAFLMQALQSLAGPGAASLGPAVNARGNHTPASTEPLMIELQNGRYVRVKGNAIDGEAQPLPAVATKNSQSTKVTRDHSAPAAATTPTLASPARTAVAAAPLPAAILIFRDGHSEEVRDYTIANNTLYARGDYYIDGYWNKKIDLAALNVSSTLDANAQRNITFALPQSPNEVITRF